MGENDPGVLGIMGIFLFNFFMTPGFSLIKVREGKMDPRAKSGARSRSGSIYGNLGVQLVKRG